MIRTKVSHSQCTMVIFFFKTPTWNCSPTDNYHRECLLLNNPRAISRNILVKMAEKGWKSPWWLFYVKCRRSPGRDLSHQLGYSYWASYQRKTNLLTEGERKSQKLTVSNRIRTIASMLFSRLVGTVILVLDSCENPKDSRKREQSEEIYGYLLKSK